MISVYNRTAPSLCPHSLTGDSVSIDTLHTSACAHLLTPDFVPTHPTYPLNDEEPTTNNKDNAHNNNSSINNSTTADNHNSNNNTINDINNNNNNNNNSNSNSIIDNTNTATNNDNDNDDYNSNSNIVINNTITAADNYNSNNSNNDTTDTINFSTLPFDTLSGTLNDKPAKFQTNNKENKANAETEQTSQRTSFDLPADSLTCFTSRAQAYIAGGQNQHQQHRATCNSSSKAQEGDFSLWLAFAHFTLSTDRTKSTSEPPSIPPVPKDFSTIQPLSHPATIAADIDPAPDDTLDSGPVTSSASLPSANNPPTILYLNLKPNTLTPRLPSSG